MQWDVERGHRKRAQVSTHPVISLSRATRLQVSQEQRPVQCSPFRFDLRMLCRAAPEGCVAASILSLIF